MKTKYFWALATLMVVWPAFAQVRIQQTATGWLLQNEKIALELRRAAGGQVVVSSLRHAASQHQWAAPDGTGGIFIQSDANQGPPGTAGFVLEAGDVREGGAGEKELTLSFNNRTSGARLSLALRVFPRRAVIEYAASLENRGKSVLPLLYRIDPLLIALRSTGLRARTPQRNEHGFRNTANISGEQHFRQWVALENPDAGETVLIGGEMGTGMLQWNVDTQGTDGTVTIHAGLSSPLRRKEAERPGYEVRPGERIDIPPVFLALAHGDSDDATNETFRYLRRFVFPKPIEGSPLATYCIWFTDPNDEEILLEELNFARRMGFDVFYHDASWFEGSSTVPGMNDWSKGLGTYRESREKFPNGLKAISDAVRKSGMKFGIWVDPGNVDSERVKSGEIPQSWLAMIDGKPLELKHPSLSPATQICFGDPDVVEWVKQKLAGIIDPWNLEWLKWDPSGTVNYACNRADHGHTRRNGLYAAYRGRMEILSYLMQRFPSLIGFECDPSLRYSRTNPGPKELLPGGYVNEFITGPMVSPNVWGSLASAGSGDAYAARLTGSWYSASSLDYHLRKHFTHGVTFGNINGMVSQRLSAAPAGYIEAFKRNLLYFKQYRHLLFEDVYHPKLTSAGGWSAVQYVKEDATEAVLFVFRDGSETEQNTVALRGLDTQANYRVTNLNNRPGRDRDISGEELTSKGLSIRLPDPWLAKGDRLPDPKFEDQLRYGSDIILLKRTAGGH